MPWTNQLPPDTRAVGTGNPPVDMNAVSEALAASGTTAFNLQNPVFGGADPGTPTTPGADCSAAFQACLTAATAVAGEMVIPPGNYTVNSGINITGPVRVRGLGTGLYAFGTGSLITGVNINSSNATGLFRFPYQGYLWGGLEMCGLGITYTGAGNVFHLLNIGDSLFRDMLITLTQAGSMAYYTTGSVSYLNVLHDRCNITTTSATRTNPMVSISSSIGAGISNNTFFKCRFTNAGLDNTQYMIFFSCTGTGSAYHFADNVRECWFEHPFGGCYKSLSGSNIIVDGCVAWDVQSGQGVTQGNSLYYFGAAASNAGSQSTKVVGCGRNLNGPDGATTWDVECESTSSNVQVENYTTSPLNPTTTYNVFLNLHGCQDVFLANNQSPQGASVNGNSTTVVTSPGVEQVSISNGIITPDPVGVWTAADNGLLAFNFDPAVSGGATAPATSVVNLMRVNVRAQISVTNIVMYEFATGGTLTSGQNWAALYDSAGTRVGITADQTTPWASTGVKTMALASGPFTLTPGIYYVAFVSNWTTSGPQFARASNFSATMMNIGLNTGATWRAATNGTATTTLPTTLTYSAGVVAQFCYWAGLS